MTNLKRTSNPRPERRTAQSGVTISLRPVVRTLVFVFFTITEYVRSGRIVVEVLAAVVFSTIFLRGGEEGVDAEKFFTMTGIFTLALTIYTVSSVLGLGDRPQSYVILARRLGRAGYLLGLYLQALLVLGGTYLLVTLFTVVLSRPPDLSVGEWLLGSLPLLLNVALLAALLLMLSPMVFSTGWRLLLLALIALAFSGNFDFFTNPILEQVPVSMQNVLKGLQTMLSWPLVPAFSGFALTQERVYNASALVIIMAQCSLLIALLSLAVYSFTRRELMFSPE